MGIVSSNPIKLAVDKTNFASLYDDYYGVGLRKKVLEDEVPNKFQRFYYIIPSGIYNRYKDMESKDLIWPFIYGPLCIASLATISASAILMRYRISYRIGSTKGIFTTVMCGCTPSFATNLGLNTYLDNKNQYFNPPLFKHSKFLEEKTYMDLPKQNEGACPLCYELRSVLVQFSTACALPLITCPLICGYIANLMESRAFPPISFKSMSSLITSFKAYIVEPITHNYAKGKIYSTKASLLGRHKIFWVFLGFQLVCTMVFKEYQISKAIIALDENLLNGNGIAEKD